MSNESAEKLPQAGVWVMGLWWFPDGNWFIAPCCYIGYWFSQHNEVGILGCPPLWYNC